MKANRRAREDEVAGAETIGAIVLFGIFVTTIALLNVTAVPQAGRDAEEEHARRALDALNNLQVSAEAVSAPGHLGATAGGSLALSPDRQAGQDFFSFFLATPARASGELSFQRDYGGIRAHHYKGAAGPVWDLGSETGHVALGRLTFNPHPVFRDAGVFQIENGGVVTTTPGSEAMRFAPPVRVTMDEQGIADVVIKARVLDGTDASVGGSTSVRVSLVTRAATLTSPSHPNANSTMLRVDTAHGDAWGAFLNATSQAAGLSFWDADAPVGAEAGYFTKVSRGAGAGGLDVVEWRVYGVDADPTTKDVRLTSGLAVHGIHLG